MTLRRREKKLCFCFLFWQNVESKMLESLNRMFCLLHRSRPQIAFGWSIKRACSSLQKVEYEQGQSPEPKIREYFYYIDHEGMVSRSTISRYAFSHLISIAAVPGRCSHQKFHIVLQGQTISAIFLQTCEIQYDESLSKRVSLFVVVRPWTEFHSMRWRADCLYGNNTKCRW